MNVASLELCKELYELSGWDKHQTDDGYHFYMLYWHKLGTGEYDLLSRDDGIAWASFHHYVDCPAYDLGYLLRKLPILDEGGWVILPTHSDDGHKVLWYAWEIEEGYYNADGNVDYFDTPEDAAARLAIELLKQGILTKGEKK